MSILSKTIIVGLTAAVSTTATSAQEMQITNFRYDKTITTESNYAVFERTARRACAHVSSLDTFRVRKECRRDLMDQAVAATKQRPMIAYHDQMIGESQQTTVLTKR